MSAAGHGLSANQELIWRMQRLLPGDPLYCEAIACRILSRFDMHALQRTCQWLIDRNPALRTTFAASAGRIVQTVRDAQPVSFRVHDARDWREEELQARFEREAYRSFDLESGPLIRACLFLRAPGEDLLLLSLHHIAADFYSLILILQEIRALYPLACRGEQPPPPTATTYLDFVRWQAARLRGPEGERLWQFWREQATAPLELLRLPADTPHPAGARYAGRTHTFTLSAELTSRLRGMAAARSATMNAALLGGFLTLLHRWCGQPRFAVRTVVSGRSEPRFAQVVGHFANAVPLPADFADDPTFATVLDRTRRAVAAAVDHQDLPLATLAERLVSAGHADASRCSDVMFRLQIPHRFRAELREERMPLGAEGATARARGPRMDLGGLVAELSNPIRSVTYHALDLELVEAGGELAGYLHYRPDMFQPATIARLAHAYVEVLASVVEEPDARVSGLKPPTSLTPASAARASLDLCGPEGRPDSVALAAPEAARAALEAESRRSRTPTEERVARIWQDLFGLEMVGLQDSFCALGGHSLLAVQLAARLSAELGEDLPLGLLLASPTVAELAAHIDRCRAG